MNHSRRIAKNIQRLGRWADRVIDRAAGMGDGGRLRRGGDPAAGSFSSLEALESRELLTAATILFEGFEAPFPSTNGWTVADVNASGTPAYWGSVDAAFGGEGVHSGDAKGFCAGVGYGGTTSSPTYQNSMRSQMSISIDLQNYYGATLEFWFKSVVSDSNNDYTTIYIDETSVWSYDDNATSIWRSASVNLDAYIGGVHTLTFEFRSNATGVWDGMYIDDIRVAGELDDPDPDDTIYQAIDLGAIPLAGSVAQSQVIDSMADVDIYAVNVVAGQTLSFDIDSAVGGSIDFFLKLIDGSGIRLTENNTNNGPLPEMSSTDPCLEYAFESSGTYYIAVSSSSNRLYSPLNGTGDASGSGMSAYDLIVGDSDLDDSISQAVAVGEIPSDAPLVISGGIIDTADDVDMFAFSVVAGQTLWFDIDHPTAGSLDSYLRLFKSDGAELADQNNSTGPAPEYAASEAFLEYTFTASGTYYLGVSGASNWNYSSLTGLLDIGNSNPGEYELTISNRIDSDDTISEATSMGSLPIGGQFMLMMQEIDRSTDVDMFAVTVIAGQTVGFDIDRIDGSTLLSYLRLFDSFGAMLAFNNNQVGPLPESNTADSYIEHTFAAAGTYYIAVSSEANTQYNPLNGGNSGNGSSAGGYQITIIDLHDPDDSFSEAVHIGAIPQGESITYLGQSIGYKDVDIVSFLAASGQKIGLDIDIHANSPLRANLVLYDPSGIRLNPSQSPFGPPPEYSSSREAYLEFEVPATGTYYVAVYAAGNYNFNPETGQGDAVTATEGDYELVLTAFTDSDGDFDHAVYLGAVPPDGAIFHSGQTIDFHDIDYVSFYVAPGQTIAIDVDNAPDSILDAIMVVYDPGRNYIAANNGDGGPQPEISPTEPFYTATFPVGGIYYLSIRAEYSGAAGLGGYDLIISELQPDGDDTLSEAIPLGSVGVDSPIHHNGQSIDFMDVDMVSFTAGAGQILGFDIDTTPGSELLSYLRLFDSAGNELATDKDSPGPLPEPVSYEAFIQYTFTTAGTYYLGISAVRNESYNPITGDDDETLASSGGYDLIITDRNDPDDAIAEAFALGVIPVGGAVSRLAQSIEYKDVDLVAFTVVAGQTLAIDIDRTPGSGLDSYLRLFTAAGTQLAFNDDDAGPSPEPSADDSFLEYTFASAGTYYLAISARQNIGYNPTTGTGDVVGSEGGYDLFIADRPPDTDDTLSEAFNAGSLAPGGSIFRSGQSISDSKDVDMVAFSVFAGQIVQFDVDTAPGGPLNSYIRLFDLAGSQLAANNNGVGPAPEPYVGDSFLQYTFAIAGTYYVGVSASGNTGYNPTSGAGDLAAATTGGYDLIISDLDPDFDDAISQAFNLGAVPLGGPVSRLDQAIDVGTDVDMVAFSVVAGQILGFDVDRTAGSSLDSHIILFDASGAILASNDNGVGPLPENSSLESYLLFTFISGGTYYLGVSGSSNSQYNPFTGSGDVSGSTGAYSLTIMDPDPDDAINQAVILGVIPLGGSVSRTGQSLDSATDVDMIAFTVSAGQVLGFDIDTPAGGSLDSHLRLFNSAGTQLASNNNGTGLPPEPSSGDSYFEYQFAAAGTYYLGISNSINQSYNALTGQSDVAGSTGAYDLYIMDPDPDDAMSQAFSLGAIPVGGSISRMDQSIDVPVDVDMLTFTVTAGQTFIFDIDTSIGGSLDSFIRLFHSTGIQLTSNNDGAGPAPEFASGDSFLEYTFAAGGTYYLGISSAGNTAYTATNGAGDTPGATTGAYNLTITNVTDPDDTIAILEAVQLGLIASGAAVSRLDQTIGYKDVDMVAFSVAAGQILGFDIDAAPGSLLDSHLRLFNSSGTQITSNGDGVGPFPEPASGDSYFEHTFAVAGTYYLGVSAAGNTAYSATTGGADVAGATGGYDLHISSLIDLDDTIALAAGPLMVPAGGQVSRTGQSTGFKDVDMVAIIVAAGQTLGFDIDSAPGGSLDSHLRLFNAAGTELAFNNDGAGLSPEVSAADSYLQFTFTDAGAYYLGISAAGNSVYSPTAGTGDSPAPTAGGYDLFITDLLSSLPGDFNNDDVLSAADIDLLYIKVRAAAFDARYDLNSDAQLSQSDVDLLVRTLLNTQYGDADLNGAVSLGDLVILAENFAQPGGWAKGDFNGDGQLTVGDLVLLAEHYGSGDPAQLTTPQADAQPQALWGLQALSQGEGLPERHQDAAEDENSALADILDEVSNGLRA